MKLYLNVRKGQRCVKADVRIRRRQRRQETDRPHAVVISVGCLRFGLVFLFFSLVLFYIVQYLSSELARNSEDHQSPELCLIFNPLSLNLLELEGIRELELFTPT